MNKRKCNSCSCEIKECFGSVKAGDFIDAINSNIEWENIRELCPKCSTKILSNDIEYTWKPIKPNLI